MFSLLRILLSQFEQTEENFYTFLCTQTQGNLKLSIALSVSKLPVSKNITKTTDKSICKEQFE